MKKIILIILLIYLVFATCCSYRYLHRPFSDFSGAADLIGKNTLYVFEQLQQEEILLRIAESTKKERLKPSDLEPKVITTTHLELRKVLIEYVVNYTKLLESVIIKEYEKNITTNAKKVNDNLQNISINHYEFLSEKETGIMTTIAAALPEALTAVRNRQFVLKFMNRHDPLIQKLTAVLRGELESTRQMLNNFYARQFLVTAAEPWPTTQSKREKFAKLGAKILDRKRKINVILDDLINAVGIIHPTHQKLLAFVKTNKGPLRTLAGLVNYASRIEAMYIDFSEEK